MPSILPLVPSREAKLLDDRVCFVGREWMRDFNLEQRIFVPRALVLWLEFRVGRL